METHSTHSIKWIIHLADLHIGSSEGRELEYKIIFEKLLKFLSDFAHKEHVIVVIAGDIFHNKTWYGADDLITFNYLIDNINKLNISIVIIPGNHDTNCKNLTSADLITPLVNDRFTYLKDTGECVVRGIKFYHISVFDTRDGLTIEAETSDPRFKEMILLYHGFV